MTTREAVHEELQVYLDPDGRASWKGALLSAVFEGRAQLIDAVSQHMEPALPLIGSHEDISVCVKQLSTSDAVMVIEDGKPLGVLTRHDLLGVHV